MDWQSLTNEQVMEIASRFIAMREEQRDTYAAKVDVISAAQDGVVFSGAHLWRPFERRWERV